MDSPFIFFPAPSSVISCLFLWSAEVLFFFSSQVGQIHWEMRKNKPKFLWEIPPPQVDFSSNVVRPRSAFTPLVLCERTQLFLDVCIQTLFTRWVFLGLCGDFFCLGVGWVFVFCASYFFFFFVLLQSTTFDNLSDPFFFCSFVYLILCRLNRKLQTSILMYLQASKLVQTI